MGPGEDNKMRKRLKNAFLENFFRETYNNLNYSLYRLPTDLAEAFSKTSLIKKAFAIISRLAKSVGNSFGITSTEIICDRWLVYIRFV